MHDTIMIDRQLRPSAGGGDSTSQLSAAFARVLQRESVRPDDDFFELGGDSIMAVALTLEIEEATGIRLPTTALFDAPSVAGLTQLISERDPVTPSAVERLRGGVPGPAIFMLPGWGGTTIDLMKLARLMETNRPIYGLRAPGLAANETPLDRIEDMAAYYLPLIRAVQPSGPYYLVGQCMGGLTAVEIARQLLREGEQVPSLVMLDTIVHPKDLPLVTKLRILARRAGHHLRALGREQWAEQSSYLRDRINGVLVDLGVRPESGAGQRDILWGAMPAATQRVMRAGLKATTEYRPRFLPATITYMEATDVRGRPRHADLIWGRSSQRLVMHRISGHHAGIFTEHVGELAAALSRSLRDADAVG